MSDSHSIVGNVLKGFVLYKKADTIFHRAAPMTKIIYLVVISILALFIGDVFLLILLAAFVGISVIIAKVPKSAIKIFTFAVIYMVIVFGIFWSVLGPYAGTTGGAVLFELNFIIPYVNYNFVFKLYEWNFLQAIRLALELFIMALGTVLLVTTTTQKEIVYGLKKMGLPYVGAFVLGLTLRSIGMFGQDYVTIKETLMSRGVNYETGNIISRLKKQLDIFVPLMIVSLRRINTISDAIESRAFKIGGKRTFFFDVKFTVWDFLASGIMLFVMVVALYYRFVYGWFDVGFIDWRIVFRYIIMLFELAWSYLVQLLQMAGINVGGITI
ncbi:MAG: energy-coupling factor transporter transmembrane component T family protein [Candidatus Asgardarchaeia archaeon]